MTSVRLDPLAPVSGTPLARRPRRYADLLAVLACLVLVPVVHSVGPVLHESYTLDEAWVALSAKASLPEVRWMTASGPLGWTLLLQPFPVGGQAQRIVPLLFLAASVGAGYAFGRLLGWRGRGQAVLAALVCAAAALLLPAQQLRHDLKQYTADGAVAVGLLALAVWVESAWSRRRAAVLLVAMGVGCVLSHVAVPAGMAVLGGLGLVALVRRAWRQLAEIAVLGAITAAGFAFDYLVIDKPGRTGDLYDYWVEYFPTLRALPGYLLHRADRLAPVLGEAWPLFVLLAAIGVVTVARTGRPATAVALVALPVGMVAAGVGKIYPLLDLRTSHFLFVTLAVAGGAGVAGIAALAGRLVPDGRRLLAAVLVAVVAVGGYTVANARWLRFPYVDYTWPGNDAAPTLPTGPTADVRPEVRYVAAHRAPGDTILINMLDQYAFAYYWSADRPVFRRGGPSAIRWYVRYPASARIVIAGDRTVPAARAALAHALASTAAGHRIWLVYSHASSDPWPDALAALHLVAVRTGPDRLFVITP